MSFKKLAALGAALFSPLLSACDSGNGPAVVNTFDRGGVWEHVIYAGKSGPILVDIHGNPFGIADEMLADNVLLHMTNAISRRVLHYTANEAEAQAPGIKVVLLFGADKTANANRICQGKLPSVQPGEGDKIDVRAVFCSDDQLMSDVEGWIKGVTGPDDKRFKVLIGDVTRQLFRTNA